MSTYFKNDLDERSSSSEGGFQKIMLYFQAINDKVQFFKRERWIAVGVLAFFYFIRLIMTGGKIYSILNDYIIKVTTL